MAQLHAYKKEHIEEILNIPANWKLRRLANIGSFFKGRGITRSELVDEGKPAILYGDIYTKYNLKIKECANHIPTDTSKNSVPINCGSVLFTGSGETVDEIGKTVVYIGNEQAFIGGDVICFQSKDVDSEFLSYALNSDISQYQKSRDSNGDIIVHTYSSKLRNVIIGIPPEPEQQKIAAFLDYKTALIDKFIANRKRQLELLQEKKAAIINKAVTKGINPDVKLKPSGVEWIGDIPEHWEVWRLRFLCKIDTGDKNTEDREENGEYPFYVRAEKVERISTFSFDGEAILTAGDGVGVARVFHYVNGKFDFHQRVYKLSNFKNVLGLFLYHYMVDNFAKEVIKLSAKTTVDSLRLQMLLNFPVVFPKESEQEKILEYIGIESHKLEILISRYQKQIDLIEEYKTALISKAVTGKIDVRDWQPPKKEKI